MQGYVIKVEKPKSVAKQTSIDGTTPAADEEKSKDLQKNVVMNTIINTGKQIMMEGVNQYFKLSGNTRLAQKTSEAISVAGDIMAIYAAGWVGAIAVATKNTLKTATTIIDTYQANKQIEYNNQLLGEISRKGSRYY